MSNTLYPFSPGYPRRLLERGGFTKPLYYKGRLFGDDYLYVAVIGSRRPTPYGMRMASWIGKICANSNCVLVSGLAVGIDGLAMKSALDGKGRVISVMPCGVDVCYPKQHQAIYDEIRKKGLIISEYPNDCSPQKHKFIERNKIVAELVDIIIVIEAGIISGTMHTVKFGLDVGVEIACIPGMITNDVARGCHHLINQGAFLIESEEKLREFIRERKKFLDISDARY